MVHPTEESRPHPILSTQESSTSITTLPQQEEVTYANVGPQLRLGRKDSESLGHHPFNSGSPSVRGGRREATVKLPPQMPSIKPSKPTSNEMKHVASDDHTKSSPKVPLLPPTMKYKKESSPTVAAKPSPPPPLRPKPSRNKKQELKDEGPYEVPQTTSNRTSTSFSDSGFKGDWPEPQTKQRSGRFCA